MLVKYRFIIFYKVLYIFFGNIFTFYYNKVSLFLEVAEFILGQNKKVRGEFYMSQSIQCLIDNGIKVFGCEVAGVKPLGTPEDIVKIRDSEYENMY